LFLGFVCILHANYKEQKMEDQNQPQQLEPASPTVAYAQPVVGGKNSKKKTVLAWLLILLLAAGIAGMYVWQQGKVNDLRGQLSSLKNSSAAGSNVKTEKVSSAGTTGQSESHTLLNGTKVTYPITEASANVIWWEDGNDTPASASTTPEGFMRVADKRVVEFLSTIPMDDIVKFCQTDFDTKTGFQMGVYDTDKKTLTLRNQYQNCIDAVAASNGKYAPQAEQVLKDAKTDLNAWAKSLTVTKK
jgi:hypothetical protein